MDLSYLLNQHGESRKDYFDAVAPPVIQASNFAFASVEAFGEVIRDEYSGNLYARGHHPTQAMLAKKLAALDGAEAALLTNSGASAITAAVLANVETGDHIISVSKPYTWVQQLFDVYLKKMGVQVTYVDGREVMNFENAVQANTKLIYLESPNSWTYVEQDLSAIARLAKEKGIVTVIDNTYATPIYQKPIAAGIDIAIQSCSKYIGGHSDVVAGVVCGREEMIRRIFSGVYQNFGLHSSPMNAWLLLRGLRTLPIRLERIKTSTHFIFHAIKNHPAIEKIYFPGTIGMGLITLQLKASSKKQVAQFCERLQHFLIAVSWGGHESLVMPKCAAVREEDFDADNDEHRMVRLYIGLEDAEILLEDIIKGLACLKD